MKRKPKESEKTYIPRSRNGTATHSSLRVHALLRYQATCGPVVLAYGRDARYLTRLGVSFQAESHRHHNPDDPPRYEVVLRFTSNGGKGTAGGE